MFNSCWVLNFVCTTLLLLQEILAFCVHHQSPNWKHWTHWVVSPWMNQMVYWAFYVGMSAHSVLLQRFGLGDKVLWEWVCGWGEFNGLYVAITCMHGDLYFLQHYRYFSCSSLPLICLVIYRQFKLCQQAYNFPVNSNQYKVFIMATCMSMTLHLQYVLVLLAGILLPNWTFMLIVWLSWWWCHS